jgi:hypothetical protein
VKQCEADIVNRSILQHPSMGYEPPADELYSQPLLRFVRARKNACDVERQNTVEDTLDLQKKCSSQSSESRSRHEADPKMGPEERKAASSSAEYLHLQFCTNFEVHFHLWSMDADVNFYCISLNVPCPNLNSAVWAFLRFLRMSTHALELVKKCTCSFTK